MGRGKGTPLFDGEKWYYFHLRNFSQNSLVCANNYGFNIETDEYFIGYSDVIERTGTRRIHSLSLFIMG